MIETPEARLLADREKIKAIREAIEAEHAASPEHTPHAFNRIADQFERTAEILAALDGRLRTLEISSAHRNGEVEERKARERSILAWLAIIISVGGIIMGFLKPR